MPTRLPPPGPLALAARVGLLVGFAAALFVAGAVLGVALFGPTQPDAPTLPFGLEDHGPPDAVLVAPATADPSASTDGLVSPVGNDSTPSTGNASANSTDSQPTPPTEPGRPLPPPD